MMWIRGVLIHEGHRHLGRGNGQGIRVGMGMGLELQLFGSLQRLASIDETHLTWQNKLRLFDICHVKLGIWACWPCKVLRHAGTNLGPEKSLPPLHHSMDCPTESWRIGTPSYLKMTPTQTAGEEKFKDKQICGHGLIGCQFGSSSLLEYCPFA